MSVESGPSAKPLTVQVREAVERGEVTLPPLPEFAARIMELLEDDSKASANSIAALVKNEPAVSATLLRMANSAAFGGLREVTNLTTAIVRLGLKQVSGVVTALVHKSNFVVEDPARNEMLKSLWDHAVITAMAARRLSAVTLGDPEEAFMAGLLHDVGKLLVLRAVEHLDAGESGIALTPELLDELMECLHAELGHQTLVEWRLPEPICRMALHHHDEEPDSGDTLMLRVQAANAIAHEITRPGEGDGRSPLDDAAIERLNLGDVEMAELMVDLEDEIAEVQSLF